MTRRRFCVLVTALSAAAIAPAPAHACGYHVAATGRVPGGPGQRGALVIGDSTSIFAVPKLARRGLSADAKECRQFSEGLSIVGGRRRSGGLPHVVVLALGANGPVGLGDLGRALRAVGTGHVLGVVTPRNSASTATAMRTFARRRSDRVVLIDWSRRSRGHGSWFGGDGLHVGDVGAHAFARLIAHRVDGAIRPPVRALPRLPRAAPRRACGTVRHRRVLIVKGPVSCTSARRVVRRPPLSLSPGSVWRWFDWRPTRRGPWLDVYLRDHRRVQVVTRRDGRGASR